MANVTQILAALEQGDSHASAELLPLVYEELRTLAAHRLARERPGQTLQATALVHEAYLRLVVGQPGSADVHWNSRGHFFAAAAEAMRRILIEQARRKQGPKQGGSLRRVELDEAPLLTNDDAGESLAIHEALDRFRTLDPVAAQVVLLRYYAGLTMPETAAALDMPLRTAERHWTYARTWLHRALS